MKFRSFKISTFGLLCLFGLVAISLSEDYVLKKESGDRGRGVFEDQSYNDPIGELTAEQRRTYAAYAKEHQAVEPSDVSEDESEGALKERDMKKLFFSEIDSYRKELSSQQQAKKDTSAQGETDEDREALRLEEEKNKSQKLKTKKRDMAVPLTGELFEGDMLMSDHFRAHLLRDENQKRDAVYDRKYLWKKENGYVMIPYEINDDFNHLKRSRLRDAIADFRKYTCIIFREKVEEDIDYVHFFSSLKSQCYSSVGRQGGRQKISIGDGCERKGTVIHEMLHSIGFIHEQSRPDRDKYVKIVWENIKKKLKSNFQKYPKYLVDNFGVKYDFDSVLHYHNSAFSKNGDPTLIDKEDPTRKFGQRIGFSKSNIEQVNRLYNCDVDPSVMDDVKYD